MPDTITAVAELLEQIPGNVLAKSIDEVMTDYAMLSIKDEQTEPAERAVEHLQRMKQLRDVFLQCNCQQ